MALRTHRFCCLSLAAACLALAAACSAPGVTGSTTSSLPDPDGTWLVTANVTSCSSASGSAKITVVNGAFNNAKIFSYTGTGGLSETVTISGTITKGTLHLIVSGNEFLTGNSCNGGNGFDGPLTSTPTSGTLASFWGSLTFVKQ